MKSHTEQNPKNSRAIAQLGESYRLMKRYSEALGEFNRAIELNSDYAWAMAHRGETYCLMNRYFEALADFNQAIELNPDYAWAYAHRGDTYRLMTRNAEALADLNRAIELTPDYAWAYACRCLSYEQMKRYKEALVDFDRTIALDETIFSVWRSDRGLLLSYCGRYAEAIEYCQQWLNQENEETHLIRYSLAVAKACEQGRAEAQAEIDKARAALQAMVNMDTGGAVLYRLGGLAALEGKADQALHYLQKALLLRGSRFETARHDPAWRDLRTDPRFQSLISDNTGVTSSPSN
ncbi:MAG: hypothetical protein DRR19_26735 [Candidatus Parabeggiatoa sp. nov. 1]|nr:MAG: hypothetical protein DRR19_26735 [Gammaproteobacteria bacterium]